MRFDPTKRHFGLLSRVALVAVAVVPPTIGHPRAVAGSECFANRRQGWYTALLETFVLSVEPCCTDPRILAN
jgi:hypothetical protein